MDPKNYLKVPSAPIYTNFEGGARRKSANFLFKVFQKVPRNALFGLFFFSSKKCLHFFSSKKCLFNALGELGKKLVDITKGRNNF